jgi:hypothetical protein
VPTTPEQMRRRDQVEGVLRLATPFLDLVLAAGERFSRIVSPAEDDHYAIRPAGERLELDGMRRTAAARRPPEA